MNFIGENGLRMLILNDGTQNVQCMRLVLHQMARFLQAPQEFLSVDA